MEIILEWYERDGGFKKQTIGTTNPDSGLCVIPRKDEIIFCDRNTFTVTHVKYHVEKDCVILVADKNNL